MLAPFEVVLSRLVAVLLSATLAASMLVAGTSAAAAGPPCDLTVVTLISAVQGTGSGGSMNGATVTVRGAVTAMLPELDGGILFVQEEAADDDGDTATSEGVAVVIGGNDLAGVAVDDIVAVSGTVEEDFGNTQLDSDSVIQECADMPESIAPTELVFPADFGDREAVEGMLVTTGAATMTITNTFSAYRFGELGLSAAGEQVQPTEVFSPENQTADANALAEANADNLIYVAAGGRSPGPFSPIPWFDDGAVNRAGATNDAPIVGPIYFEFGDHLLQFRDGEEPTFTGERPAAPDLDPGARIATFNVLNLFNGDGAGGGFPAARGATTFEAYQAQRDGIVRAILGLDAAVVGLIEIENDYRQGELSSIAQLVDALNAAADPGEDDWSWVDPGGNLGPDEIAVGLIHRDSLATQSGAPATFDVDANLGENPADPPDPEEALGQKNRWPLAQTFDVGGVTVTPVVNHFKSKGSSCDRVFTTYDDPQPDHAFASGDDVTSDLTANCNLTRVYAAAELMDWLDTNPTGDTSSQYVIGGDLNSYTEEAPLALLRNAGFVDLVSALGGDKFSYQFEGQFGRLNQLLAAPAASDLFVDADVWQINSPESISFLYENEDTPGVHASSDHDPSVVALAGRSPSVTRLAGETRVDTAVAISQATFPDGARTAYISRSDSFPDAVGAGPLAAADGAPILLTDRAVLSPATRQELGRLGVTEIIALGGPVAIGQAVVDALGAIAPTRRLAGQTRYDTAALVSGEQAHADVVYVATGERFPDALTGGAAAARDGAPVLLVPFDTIPDSVRAELARRSPDTIVVLGGPVVIDGAVETALGAFAETVERIAGETRYDTAALVGATFAAPVGTVHLATGEAFPDALAGVPAAAAAGGPILLTRPEALTDVTATSIEALDPDDVVILGGPIAVSEATEISVKAALLR